MISRLASLFRSARPDRSQTRPACVDQLEKRVLFHAQATSIYADNRGGLEITFNQQLDPATVNTRGVFMFIAGPDDVFLTEDDQKIIGRVKLRNGNRRILFVPDEKVPFEAGTTFAFKLNSSRIKGADGDRIDAEFNGSGVTTGNGEAGGDLLAVSRRNKDDLVARFSTIAGNIDVRLFLAETPKNVANFITYANAGHYDNTFIQRNLPGFIWQSGGFVVTKDNQIDVVPSLTPVENEPAVTQAVRGTLSLARPDDDNPATDDRGTNQFFFNLVNNEDNLGNQNGGFTEFGAVITAGGLAVMDALAGFPTVNGGGQFTNLAVQNSSITVEQASADPQGTLVTIRKIAIRNKVGPWLI